MFARRFPDLLSSLLCYLLRHAHHHQPRLQAHLGSHRDRQIQALMHDFGANLLQSEPLALLIKEGRSVTWARQEESPGLGLLLEPLQCEIAFVGEVEGPRWDALAAQG